MHPDTGVQYWKYIFTRAYAQGDVCVVARYDSTHIFRTAERNVAVRFIDERHTGLVVEDFEVYVSVRDWMRFGLAQPTWAVFIESDRVMSTTAGMFLGLIPT